MQIHASCVVRQGEGVLLLGEPGGGKSSLALRLIGRGFLLVADDRVELDGKMARPAAALAGLIEVRGLGVIRLPYEAPVRVAVAVELGGVVDRMPSPRTHALTGAPLLGFDAADPALPEKVAVTLDCALGRLTCVAGGLPGT